MADDSAFLDCAKYTDRVLRLTCLETTLNQALQQRNAMPGNAVTQPAAPTTAVQGYRRPVVDEKAAEQRRVESFGLESRARVSSSDDGKEELMDKIMDLDQIRPNMWDVTLDSGQVWRQVHPKRFALRKGDTVHITSSGWGDNYRLSTSRLDGFIQVERIH